MNTLWRVHAKPQQHVPCLAALLRSLLMAATVWAQLFLGGVHCFAQDPTGSGTSKLEGVVINAMTGKPVPRALVQVISGGRRAMLTGAQGEFEFDAIPVGQVSLHVLKPGFSQEGTTNFRTASTFEVTAGSGKAVIKLVPECVITGQVIDADGEPLEGVQLMVMQSEIVAGTRRLLPAGRSQGTDEDGNFRVASLVPGKYYVAVRAGNAMRRVLGAQSGKRKVAYPPIFYYPSSVDLEGATPLDFTAAQHATLEFIVKPYPAFKVSGTVSGLAGWKQVNNPWLTDRSGQVLTSAEQFDRTTGNFEFQAVPAGNYFVRIGAMNESGQYTWVQTAVSVEAEITGLKLGVGANNDIPVVVRTEFSSAHSGRCAGTSSDCDQPPVRVMLRSAEASMGFTGYGSDSAPGSPSSMKISNVSPGRYVVQVFAMVGGGYVQSAHSGGANLLREELVVPTEGSVPPIEVTVRDDSGSVKVHVNSDQPNAKAWALVVSESAPRQNPVLLNVEPGTDREYSGLAPGDYKVFAFDSTDGLEYTNPSVMSRYNSKAARVSILAKGTASVGVDLIHKDEE